MKLLNLIFGAVSIAAVLYVTTSEVWARGGGGSSPTCLVDNPGSGAIALRGTVAADVTSGIYDSVQDIDLTLSLDKGGVMKFFRLHQNLSLVGEDSDTILCRFLDPIANPNPDVQAFVNQILDAFGFARTRQLVITSKSISNADEKNNTYFCVDAASPCTQHASNIADVTIWAK